MRYLVFEGQLLKEGIVKVGDWAKSSIARRMEKGLGLETGLMRACLMNKHYH